MQSKALHVDQLPHWSLCSVVPAAFILVIVQCCPCGFHTGHCAVLSLRLPYWSLCSVVPAAFILVTVQCCPCSFHTSHCAVLSLQLPYWSLCSVVPAASTLVIVQRCPCGTPLMTVEHILWLCPTHRRLPAKSWSSDTSMREKLCGRFAGLLPTAVFIRPTGCAVWVNDEEGEEGITESEGQRERGGGGRRVI